MNENDNYMDDLIFFKIEDTEKRDISDMDCVAVKTYTCFKENESDKERRVAEIRTVTMAALESVAFTDKVYECRQYSILIDDNKITNGETVCCWSENEESVRKYYRELDNEITKKYYLARVDEDSNDAIDCSRHNSKWLVQYEYTKYDNTI